MTEPGLPFRAAPAALYSVLDHGAREVKYCLGLAR